MRLRHERRARGRFGLQGARRRHGRRTTATRRQGKRHASQKSPQRDEMRV
ncbi:hypothetical protein ARMA_1508 [Ardenticatena maritima]|uniref:Uncharacterized protein n=1 Tax=Ardenticatena maritima TaxID=872965 RepID=A0A0M8K9K6_9CHLR|nr:hypothetical protein ARMA_1508 [Ardenticatena maritima]